MHVFEKAIDCCHIAPAAVIKQPDPLTSSICGKPCRLKLFSQLFVVSVVGFGTRVPAGHCLNIDRNLVLV